MDVLVVDEARIALSGTWFNAIQAVVEPGAVARVRVVGMGDDLTVLVRAGLLGAHEAVAQFLCVGWWCVAVRVG